AEFVAGVDAAAADPARHHELADLLREEHPAYAGRGAAAVVRMRGWALLALARVGLTDATLAFALEELATGHDPYLVAAAARALPRARPLSPPAGSTIPAPGPSRSRSRGTAGTTPGPPPAPWPSCWPRSPGSGRTPPASSPGSRRSGRRPPGSRRDTGRRPPG